MRISTASSSAWGRPRSSRSEDARPGGIQWIMTLEDGQQPRGICRLAVRPVTTALAADRRPSGSRLAHSSGRSYRFSRMDFGTPSPQNQASGGACLRIHPGAAGGAGGPPDGASTRSSRAQRARDGDRIGHRRDPEPLELTRPALVPGLHRKQQPRERGRRRTLRQHPHVRKRIRVPWTDLDVAPQELPGA